MPSKVLVARPEVDEATQIMSRDVAEEFVRLASSMLYTTIDLRDGDASRAGFEYAVKQYGPEMVALFSHGDADKVVGWDNSMLDASNAYLMKGRILYLCACKSASTLGDKLIEEEASAVIGYKDTLTVVTQGGGMLEAFRNVLRKPSIILMGRTVGEAYNETLGEYERWIEYYDQADPLIADILRSDRDALVLKGDENARLVPATYIIVANTTAMMQVMIVIMLIKILISKILNTLEQ